MSNRRRDMDSSRAPRVLVVDDDPLIAILVESAFDETVVIHTAETAAEARRHFEQTRADIVLLDQMLPDAQGLDLLQYLLSVDSRLPVLFITARDGSEVAIEAMKRGAFDYLAKPLGTASLKRQINLALEARRLTSVPVVIESRNAAGAMPEGDVIIGRCPAMAEVYKSIGRAAARDLPALVTGEPGTGKALVGRAIYQHGTRAQAPLRTLNCSDFSAVDLDIELFGGPTPRGEAVGLLRQIQGGTLLLEEISACGLTTQSKLLQLLTQSLSVSEGTGSAPEFQLIASTSIDLEAAVTNGEFRADLYYAIRSIRIHLPPLRERKSDLPALIDYYVRRFSRLSRSLNQAPVRVSSEALDLLCQHDWPGNLDELQSVLRQALVNNTGTILADESLRESLGIFSGANKPIADCVDAPIDWDEFIASRLRAGSNELYAEAINQLERRLLPRAMEVTKGNQLRAAAILGMTRGSLRKKLRNLGLLGSSADDGDESRHET